VEFAGEESVSDFVERDPLPGKLDIGNVVLLADAGDGDEFALGGGNGDRGLAGICGGDEIADSFDAGGSQDDVPARRGNETGRAGGGGGGDPSVTLQDQVFGGKIILVGDDAGTKNKLLLGVEGLGG